MAEPHNYRTVGYSMIMLSAALVVIGLLYLAIGDDVLYSDHVSKQKQLEYKQLLEEQSESQLQGKNVAVNLNEDISMQNNP